jgi:hypothetical protein
MPGKLEEPVTLVEVEVEPVGQGREDLLGRDWAAALLDPAVVVAGDAADGGYLLPPKAAGPTARPPRQPDVFRLKRLPPGAKELR